MTQQEKKDLVVAKLQTQIANETKKIDLAKLKIADLKLKIKELNKKK